MTTTAPDLAERKRAYISLATKQGWTVLADGDWGLQLCRSKVYKESFLWGGAILLIFGIGILVWIWGYLDYLARRDEVLFVSAKELLSEHVSLDVNRLA